MAYTFQNQKVASFKLNSDVISPITLNGVNGSESNANTIVNGVEGLLWIASLNEDYDYTEGVRTVKQSVNNDE